MVGSVIKNMSALECGVARDFSICNDKLDIDESFADHEEVTHSKLNRTTSSTLTSYVRNQTAYDDNAGNYRRQAFYDCPSCDYSSKNKWTFTSIWIQ